MNETEIATSGAIQVVGYDALTPLLRYIFGADGLLGGFTIDGILGFLSTVWGIFAILAYITTFIFLALYIYASIQKEKLEELQKEKIEAGEHAYAMQSGGEARSNRFAELQAHIDSDNPNDWKLAIIEADIILDDVLKRQGYAGTSLGERLRSVSPSALSSLDAAWQAHKVRNQIAHAGAEFVLTHKIARETIMLYERVFSELGVH